MSLSLITALEKMRGNGFEVKFKILINFLEQLINFSDGLNVFHNKNCIPVKLIESKFIGVPGRFCFEFFFINSSPLNEFFKIGLNIFYQQADTSPPVMDHLRYLHAIVNE